MLHIKNLFKSQINLVTKCEKQAKSYKIKREKRGRKMKKKCGAALGAFLLISGLCSFGISAEADTKALSYQTANRHTEELEAGAVLKSDTEVSSRFLELLLGKKKKGDTHIDKKEEKQELMLCPGGDIFGIKIAKETVSVTGTDAECILKYGDIIISIDGKSVRSLADVKKILGESDGGPVDIVIERGGERFEAELTPKKQDGEYKLGAVLKDGVAGIGTVSYYDPKTGEFGGLGHGICEPGAKEPVKMRTGSINGVILGGVDKSREGDPGELSGLLTDKVIGELYSNTSEGVFGKFNTPPDISREMLPVGNKADVREGEAKIYSTVKNGRREEYKIEIFDIDKDSDGSKSFKVRVTDEELKTLTGGIVRGMSGSPIVQDGKLIGAVTHVMVANPTEGYGIFIENMLDASQMKLGKAA